MKHIILFILFFIGLAACNKTVYVPVETVRTDCRYILSKERRLRVAEMHAAAIKKMFEL
jgi:hypothetical protein